MFECICKLYDFLLGKADVHEPDLKRPKLMGHPGMIMAPPPGMMYPLVPGMVPPVGMQVMPGMVPLPMGGVPAMVMMNPRLVELLFFQFSSHLL